MCSGTDFLRIFAYESISFFFKYSSNLNKILNITSLDYNN